MVKTKVELKEKLAEYIKSRNGADTKELTDFVRSNAPKTMYVSGQITASMLQQIKTAKKDETGKWRIKPLL